MYVFGGLAGVAYLDELYRFCFADRRWTRVRTEGCVPALKSHTAVVFQARLALVFILLFERKRAVWLAWPSAALLPSVDFP